MKRRSIGLLLVLVLAVMSFAGCKSDKGGATSLKADGSIDTSKEVNLTLYLLGDKAADFDKVYGKVNEILKEKVNATLDVKFLSWAEHDAKYSLLFSSGEDFDLIFTATTWAHYETTAAMKGFYEMKEDFIKTYAPDVYDVVPAAAWTQAKIDGKGYMVPNYQNEYGVDLIGVRGDLMKKYGIAGIENTADLENYYDKIAKNEKTISPLATQGGGLIYPYLFQNRGWQVLGGVPAELFLYEYNNPDNMNIEYTIDSPEYLKFAHKMKEMYTKGYWSADSASSTATRDDNWKQGKSASMVWNLGSVSKTAREINVTNPEWEATFVDIAPNVPKRVNSYINNGVAINAASKNPERAMMVINELYTNKDIYDLTSVGIEDIHYTAVGVDKYVPLAGAEAFPANGSCNWGWTNMMIRRELLVENPDAVYLKQQETLAKWDANPASGHIFDTFAFNGEKVKTEIAIVSTLLTQYYDPISMGMVEDVDAAVAELSSKLKTAGIDKIYEEIKSQTAEFAKSMK